MLVAHWWCTLFRSHLNAETCAGGRANGDGGGAGAVGVRDPWGDDTERGLWPAAAL
jgi:hypothetical protein